MAYTKTAWVNGSAPAINATNLNKIEQGIADASNGWQLISTQDVTDLTTGGPAVDTVQYSGWWFPDLDILPYTRFKLRFKYMSANGWVYHKQRMYFAFDIDQTSTDYKTDSDNDLVVLGIVNNNGTLTGTDQGAGVQQPYTTPPENLWYIDANFEFGFMQDTVAGAKLCSGQLSIAEQEWNITEMAGISGPFNIYNSPSGYIDGNKPKNIWFVCGLALNAGQGNTFDFSSDVYECECTLFGMT